jgi:hypothetical protein
MNLTESLSATAETTRPVLTLVPMPTHYEFTEPAPKYDAREMDSLQSVCYLLDRFHEIEILAPKALKDEMIDGSAIQRRISEVITLLQSLQTAPLSEIG